ncbi:MAG: FAD-binding protein, partial [Pseudoflavonifractor sp.]
SSAILAQPEKYAYMILDQAVMDSMAALQANYKKGLITKGDTLADLAAAIGTDPAALDATITTWNKAVADKKDAEFGRETGMDADLSHAPYYAIKVSPAVHYTMGGIKFNTLTQVISTANAPIPGLYAAGEVTGGLHGGNRLGGNAVADIMIYGRQAGAQSAKFALENGTTALAIPAPAAAVVPLVDGNYKDGTYEGEGKGRDGAIKVSLTVVGGNITAIQVTDQVETAAIFAGVERDLIPQIIRTQSPDVDAVAGATMSSVGVIQAVTSALSGAK